MKVHLIAIGGTGMGALAGLLGEAGDEVRGSDGPLYPPMSTQLEELGIPVQQGYRAENLDWGPDLVVLGNSCRKDHVEYVAALSRGLRVVSFPELLAERFLADRHPIVVAGTHGKTTTSSMIAVLLRDAALEPGHLIGGIPHDLGRGFGLGKPPYFVVEGDEYDCACFDKRPKFVHYQPQTLVLTGIEFDHADIYDDLEQVKAAFGLLFDNLSERAMVFVAADSEPAMRLSKRAGCQVETYAISPETEDDLSSTRRLAMPLHWHATYEPLGGGAQLLRVTYNGEELGALEVPMSGAHNMANALAAIAVARRFEIGFDTIARSLSKFGGVARRQQVRGIVDEITVIDDFAHHPTAVRETLRGMRNRRGKLVAVFEPRSATSRRKIFQRQYAHALAVADRVLLAPLFAAERIPEEQRLDLEQLAEDLRAMGRPTEVADVDAMVESLAASLEPEDTVVVMSSGSFDGLHDKLLAALEAR